jgi:hypothetical protein
MTHIQEMLSTHPQKINNVDRELLTSTINAIFTCAQTCEACADACLGESDVQSLVHCIRTDRDCADVCYTTGAMLVRQTSPDWNLVRAQLQACVTACDVCAAECESHASHHEHCRICAEKCRNCEDACKKLLTALPA